MKHIYFFGNGHADGNAQMTEMLGSKGANLAEMTNLGIPVPPGFTVSSELCRYYLAEGSLPDDARAEFNEAMTRLEQATGRGFGDASSPLLLSVRSGASVSMPGMMDTILNLGLDERSVVGLAEKTGDSRFAWDSYRRLIQMYGEVVAGIGAGADSNPFETQLEALGRERAVARDIDLDPDDLKALVRTYKEVYAGAVGHAFPDDPWDQARGAVEAVFGSWNTERARRYRQVHGIADDLGTAINVQAMVYGNRGDDSGAGVVFTRDPSTGEPALYGEFLANAQGEDVVAGTRDPGTMAQLAEILPEAHRGLVHCCELLERHYRDMQDVEFTIERGRLFILQTRTGKRTAKAAVRIAVDMAKAGMIDRGEALLRVEPGTLPQLLHPTVDRSVGVSVLTKGLPASPGAACGRVVFDAHTAIAESEAGVAVILVRRETSADDFGGMVAARAILTARGGMTSHAAVVARGMGKCCVAGASGMVVDERSRCLRAGGHTVREGETITVDGSSGEVLLGEVPLVEARPELEFEELMGWADDARRLRVRANADTPADAERARGFGAEGIGLCRTEHMFFGDERIAAMREMILAVDEAGRRRALEQLLPMQRADFAALFRVMAGLPVTIRLLDPPLHEFLPRGEGELAKLAADMGAPLQRLREVLDGLAETNPMLGHRGCRLGISYPEITQMQVRAVFEAACDVAAEGVDVHPQVMVPLVSHVEELRRQAGVVRETAECVFAEKGRRVEFLLGTMIELPRAAITADELAEVAQFFSFGTNDLTQTAFGMSRDDAGRFLSEYVRDGVLPNNPFEVLDRRGVGRLIETAARLGRAVTPELELGLCGEHGGEASSIEFCHTTGLDYVSCSPFRVLEARLAAAQAALRDDLD